MSTTREPTIELDGQVEELDCRGLLCPLPVYKAGLALGRLEPGDRVRLITTDPGALEDIPAMARQRGDTLISVQQSEGQQTFLIQKGGQT